MKTLRLLAACVPFVLFVACVPSKPSSPAPTTEPSAATWERNPKELTVGRLDLRSDGTFITMVEARIDNAGPRDFDGVKVTFEIWEGDVLAMTHQVETPRLPAGKQWHFWFDVKKGGSTCRVTEILARECADGCCRRPPIAEASLPRARAN